MSSVRKVVHRSGAKVWQARWRDPTGRQRSRNFDRKVDAERHLVETEMDMIRGRYADPKLGRVLFGDWLEDWQNTRVNLAGQTRARDRSILDNHVLPTFGPLQLGQLHPALVAAWVAELDRKGLSPATTRKAYELVAAACSAAVDNGMIPTSPCRNIKLPKLISPDMRFLEPAEINSLAASIDSRYSAMVLTAAYTGLRFGELAALKVERLNKRKRILRVEETLAEVKGALSFKEPKSRASRRTVSVPTFLIATLERHFESFPNEHGLVFGGPQGGPIRRTNFRRRVWLPAVEESVGQPCTFHDLRHTHAALLIAQSEHPKVIQERLGHASIRTTLDTYGHLFEGLDEAAADRLDASWRESEEGPRSKTHAIS